MTIKVGINGYGRIGRNMVRAVHELGRTGEHHRQRRSHQGIR